MRVPKGVPAAAGRPAAGLSCTQHKMKLLSAGVKTEFFSAGLSSPLMNAVPAGYFTQICNTTAAEQRANSLYSTPHGPEAKPIRASSGRLPVRKHTNTHTHLEEGGTLFGMHVCNPLSHQWICKQGRDSLCRRVCVCLQPFWVMWHLFLRPAVVTVFACSVCVYGLGGANIWAPSFVKRGGTSAPHGGG